MPAADQNPAFTRLGPSRPTIPVILSVPHAGREYSAALQKSLRVPLDRIVALEDRHVDRLAGAAAEAGVSAIIARPPRAWIDLNRREDEVDPGMVTPQTTATQHAQSLKVRGGLGLVPRRLSGIGDLWHDRIALTDLNARIEEIHRPYHMAIAAMIADAHAQFGIAVLIDLHSMPPVTGADWPRPPRIVIGDRFGRSASGRFTARLMNEAHRAGLSVAENSPYAGGYVLERHGAPARGVHAVQIEIDRSLYLKADLSTVDEARADAMSATVRAMVLSLADEALAAPQTLAAE